MASHDRDLLSIVWFREVGRPVFVVSTLYISQELAWRQMHIVERRHLKHDENSRSHATVLRFRGAYVLRIYYPRRGVSLSRLSSDKLSGAGDVSRHTTGTTVKPTLSCRLAGE